MRQHVHIFGASGSGTTSIAQRAAQQLGYAQFDSDDYFWLPTDSPFTTGRPNAAELLGQALAGQPRWILSGSVMGWGDALVPLFDLAVFVYVPPAQRMQRLQQRERQRYGDDALPGGYRHAHSQAFLAWAAAYDDNPPNGRSLAKHEAWLAQLDCDCLRLVNHDLDDSTAQVVRAICAAAP